MEWVSDIFDAILMAIYRIFSALISNIKNLFLKYVAPYIRGTLKAVLIIGRPIAYLNKWALSIIIFVVSKLYLIYKPFSKILTPLLLISLWIFITPLVLFFSLLSKYILTPLAQYIVRIVSIATINKLASLTRDRPALRSLYGTGTYETSYYPSWGMLTDRFFNSRSHLPTSAQNKKWTKENKYGNSDIVAKVFLRQASENEIKDERSSILFPFFARWLTDSFMRINAKDRRKNSSNHELDLCQIYGLAETETNCLRLHRHGRLRSRYFRRSGDELTPIWDADGEQNSTEDAAIFARTEQDSLSKPVHEEFLPLLFESKNSTNGKDYNERKYTYKHYRVKEQYHALIDRHLEITDFDSLEKYINENVKFALQNPQRSDQLENILQHTYATGLERGNASVGYTMFSTLFLREHNRICDLLRSQEGGFDGDDEKLFQTARMINVIIYLKIIILSYINHISGSSFKWGFYPDKLSKPNLLNLSRIQQPWFKPNWVSLEFNLLYRWHSFIPNKLKIKGKSEALNYFFQNNESLEHAGLEEIFNSVSRQRANKLTLQNTPRYLEEAEKQSLMMNRRFRLASYNQYRKLFQTTREIESLQQLCGKELSQKIVKHYRQASSSDLTEQEVFDNLDFYVGLFAEKRFESKPFGELIFRMVASDAFTHLYRNPVLSPEIFNAEVLTNSGMQEIEKTNSLEDVLIRNTSQLKVMANFEIQN